MAYGIEQKVAFERVEPLLKMFRLDQKLDWFPVHFSKGMKQKVMIICALWWIQVFSSWMSLSLVLIRWLLQT